MNHRIQQLLQEVLQDMKVSGITVDVSISENPNHGEYTTNVAMKLSKSLKKSPMDIALQVKSILEQRRSSISHDAPDQKMRKRDQKNTGIEGREDVLQDIDTIEVAAPGFINIFLTEAAISSQVSRVIKAAEVYGKSQSPQAKRVTVEFTDPNPFKEFHIGHLYSNSVGESLSRLFESQGHTVRRVCYQGDVGMHVAKALYGLLHTDAVTSTMEALRASSPTDRAKFLGSAYAVGAKAFEEDPIAAEEMKGLNKLAFIAAQHMWEQQKNTKPIVDYRGETGIDEAKLDQIRILYELGRAWSLEYLESIYQRLGTAFSGYYFESMVGERGVTMVRAHMKDGIFEESDGAVVYKGEKKGLHTRVFINQLGLPTYEAKELGLAPTKYEDWAYDQSYIVTGNEINEYFKVLLAALSEIEPELAAKTKHIGHGMVRKSDGTKMSSRSGVILSGEGLLDEVKQSIYDLVDKNKSEYTPNEREEITEKAAVAAVKYSLLRVSLPSDVAFDISTSVSFDGDSGPYLLYAYARCKSVLKKSNIELGIVNTGKKQKNPEERLLARYISFFPEIVAEAASSLNPSLLCNYLFKLASIFSLFYQKHVILGEPERIHLTAATAQVLKNGLYLLGIATAERM